MEITIIQTLQCPGILVECITIIDYGSMHKNFDSALMPRLGLKLI